MWLKESWRKSGMTYENEIEVKSKSNEKWKLPNTSRKWFKEC